MKKYSLLVIFLLLLVFFSPTSHASTTCTFTTVGTVMTLDADCTTDETLFVPDGYTLTGAHNTITAIDPTGGHFLGAVVKNAGSTAYVENIIVETSALTDVCDAGDARLRGILFEAASGSITSTRVRNINQGPSGCQEGNAIEVRNAPFDGSHPATVTVEVANNIVETYQKTGILANGDVNVDVHNNTVKASATQANLAANSIQLGFGALGSVYENNIKGNQWLGPSEFAATAMLLFATDSVSVTNNNISGNSDVGIYIAGSGGTYTDNFLTDIGPDGPHGDWGIFNEGTNTVENNTISRGFVIPYEELTESLETMETSQVVAFE